MPLAVILSGVNADARPTSVTSGATEDVRLTGAASGVTGNAILLA